MNLNSDTWCDLVFEDKNKEYGAYYLRKTSSKRHAVALAIVTSIIGILVPAWFYIRNLYHTDEFEFKSNHFPGLSIEESIHLEDPVRSMLKEPPLKEKTNPSTPEITKTEEITKPLEEEENTTAPADSVGDSTTNADPAATQAQQLPSEDAVKTDGTVTLVLDSVHLPQEFKLLQTTLFRYVYQNLKYPEVAYKQKIHGRVIYSFIVNPDGSISDVTLVQGVYIFLDEEVLRVIHSLSALEPVKKEGKPIRVRCYLPVLFSL